ncbi:hypothetical protein MMC07_005074 [Pseudocyphellaria aurata]|nr:hypothetical protein [Pseudocyphellaria aurata]
MVPDVVTERVKFLMTKLEPVILDEIDPDDRLCSICQDELVVPESGKPSHSPVKTSCGHIFGKTCVIRWFDPLDAWGLYEYGSDCDPESDSDRSQLSDVDDDHGYDLDELEDVMSEPGRSGCPICRQVFFSRCVVEPMENASQRIFFWDMAYASAGVARSEHEESSRAYLLQYIEYCRSINDNTLDFDAGWYECMVCVQEILALYVRFLEDQKLTPEQEILRKKLERISRKDLKKCTFKNGCYDFNIESDDNERDLFKKYPLKEDEKVLGN